MRPLRPDERIYPMAGLSERVGNDSPLLDMTTPVIETGRSLEGAEIIAANVAAGELPIVTELEEVSHG